MRPVIQSPSIRRLRGEWVRSNQQKANLFAEYLESTFQPYEKRNI